MVDLVVTDGNVNIPTASFVEYANYKRNLIIT